MEWKYLFAISAYILTACDPVAGATGITNVVLADGLTPNEGRVEYDRSGIVRTSACGGGLSFQEASVVCRQLGYEGVNNIFDSSPFGQSTSIDQQILNCDGDEETLADCSLLSITSSCSNAGGVICYESGYTGCYTYQGLAQGDLQNPCENGLQNLTIPKCVSLCHDTSDNYTYAGLYRGDTCFCGDSSTTISQDDRADDNTDPRFCSSSCAGRNIERCGGESHIALFNIALYLQNTNRIASPPGCIEPTPTQTEGDETTTVRTQSSSSSASSPPTPSPSVPSTDRTTTEGLTTTVHTVSETNNPTQSTRELVTICSTFSTGTSTQSENFTCPQKPECSSSKGVQIGLIVVVGALLLYAVAITIFLIQLRRKVPTRTGENGPDPYMDLRPRPETDKTYKEMAITSTVSSKNPGESRLPSSNLFYENQNVAQYANKIKDGADMDLQPRPEADRTYHEMAITSTASSKKTGESRLPSSNLFYENQNVAQYANKIKEGADYEDVLTPN